MRAQTSSLPPRLRALRCGRALGLLVITGLSAIGCSEEPPAKPGDESNLKEHKAIEGPEVVRCSVALDTSTTDEFFRADRLSCEYHAPTAFPVSGASAIVQTRAKDGQSLGSAVFPEDAPASGEPLEIARVHPDKYPIRVEVRLSLAWDSSVRDIPFVSEMVTEFTVTGPDGDPISASIPFDLWPVDVDARKAPFVGKLDYALDLAPFATDGGATTLAVQRSLRSLLVGETGSYLVAVTHGAPSIAGLAFFDESVQSFEQGMKGGAKPTKFELTGPGTYLAEPEGLRGKTEADEEAQSDGPALASCWLDVSAEAGKHDVRCQLTSLEGLQVPAGAASVTDAAGAVFPEATLSGTEPVTVASLDDASLPASIALRLSLAGDAVGLRPDLLSRPIEATLDIATPDALTSAAPGIVKLPFDLWPVTIEASPDTGFIGDLDPYMIILNGTWNGLSALSVPDVATPFIQHGVTQTFYIVTDSHLTSLSGKATLIGASGTVNQGIPFTLERGGRYRTTPDGLVKASP